VEKLMGNYNKGDGHVVFISYDKDAKPYLEVEPDIEEITKQDVINFYNDFKHRKPRQPRVGEFVNADCSRCGSSYIVHKSQPFCPRCFKNDDFYIKDSCDEKFRLQIDKWVKELKVIEQLMVGNIIKFVKNVNETLPRISQELDKDISNFNPNEGFEDSIGDEIKVDEDYEF